MNIILTSGIFLMIFSFLFRKKLPPYWGVIVIFLIMGFQDGVEGDFLNYKEVYENFTKYSNYQIRTSDDEPVWNWLFKTCAPNMPFWGFVVLLSGFECFVLFLIVRKYGSEEYGWLGPILFFFTFYLMLIQMKAMRQGLAVELLALSFFMIERKQGIYLSALLFMLAYYTHNSALVAAPILIVQAIVAKFFDKKNDKDTVNESQSHNIIFPIAMLFVYMVVYMLKSTSLNDWLGQMALAAEDNDSRLSEYLTTEQQYAFNISWLIVLYDGVMVFLCSWFIQRATWRNRIFAIASIVGCYGDMLLFGLGSLPRMMMFYYLFNIITYPHITEMINAKLGRISAAFFVLFIIGYAIKTSLPWITGVADDRFGTYHFIFY